MLFCVTVNAYVWARETEVSLIRSSVLLVCCLYFCTCAASLLGLSMAFVDPVTSLTLSLPWLLRAWRRAEFPVGLCGLCFLQRSLNPEMSPWLHRVVFIVLPINKRNSAQVKNILRGIYAMCLGCILGM